MKEAQDEEEKKKADEEAKNSEPEDDEDADDEDFDDEGDDDEEKEDAEEPVRIISNMLLKYLFSKARTALSLYTSNIFFFLFSA